MKDVQEAEERCRNNSSKEMSVEEQLPKVQGTFHSPSSPNRFSIVCSRQNGLALARCIEKLLVQEKPTVVADLVVSESQVEFQDIERRVSLSSTLVVLLTADALKQAEVVFAMQCAKHYFPHSSQVTLVHDAASCFFPGHTEQPASIQEFFSEKAITFLSCYAVEAVLQILEKWEEEMTVLKNAKSNKWEIATDLFCEAVRFRRRDRKLAFDHFKQELMHYDKSLQSTELDVLAQSADTNHDGLIDLPDFCNLLCSEQRLATVLDKYFARTRGLGENISTTVFLSHKRSTGQGIAGRLYEGLRDDYSVFLDSEAKFKIHDLKQIVLNTRIFVLILTSGILQSQWCLEELKSAISNNKKIVIVRELAFQLPQTLPIEWQDSLGALLERGTELVWIAEYNSACIDALKRIIGCPDRFMEEAEYRASRCFDEQEQSLNARDTSGIPLLLATRHNLSLKSASFTNCAPLMVEMKYYLNTCTTLSITAPFKPVCRELYLGRSHSLTCLDLTGNTELPPKAFVQIGNCISLTDLTLDDCHQVTDEAMKAISRCSSLRKLSFRRALYITDAGMIPFFQNCSSLQVLHITQGNSITDLSMEQLALHCHKLAYFSLDTCDEITDYTLDHLVQHAKSLPNLSSIWLRQMDNFTDSGVIRLAKTFKPQLQKLTFVMKSGQLIEDLMKEWE